MSGLWVYICCGWVAFQVGGFVFGWDSSYINGVMSMPRFIKDHGHIVDHRSSTSYVGVVLQISPIHIAGSIFGCIIASFSVGLLGLVNPMYISEVAPPRI
ncbi:hypothetical protein K435DRAFT_969252 [Dendrothele bispora CBS 962.96]|uniref:Major facilitator superfamily (MFS) profile domain-containing protein n=1 Tax=Dendrothele bispora (strain CBS 962.96) TaxID=1314807 RepID=A0A4S8LIV5_DENBC|nr:hypothetical protein K435DRAFT_969252 [Dendrothele bispora CBS 962.96]